MFDIDKWQEIFATIRKNKLRTFLTGFSVAWGIFMLIVLLGSGNGLQNGVEYQFKADATNTLWLYPGSTTMAYQGMKPGRQINFTNEDYTFVKENIPGIEEISARYYFWENRIISYKKQFGSFDLICVHPDMQVIEKISVSEGRMLNQVDLERNRKVVIIGLPVKAALFKNGENPLGEYIKVNGVPFKVVGVFTDRSDRDQQTDCGDVWRPARDNGHCQPGGITRGRECRGRSWRIEPHGNGRAPTDPGYQFGFLQAGCHERPRRQDFHCRDHYQQDLRSNRLAVAECGHRGGEGR